jgi:hypothetical protein
MNKDMKIALMAAGAFVIATSAVVAGHAVYTNIKVGVDKQAMAIAAVVGIGTGILVAKYLA